METFFIPRLDTEAGLIRASGDWDPLTAEIQLTELDLMGTDGWMDVSFWLTEQEHEARIEAVLVAAKRYLVRH